MQIKKEYKHYSAHRNQDLLDKCSNIHGHDYKVFMIFNVVRKGSISTLFSDFDKYMEPFFKDVCDHKFLIDKNDPLLKYLRQYEKDNEASLGLTVVERPTSVENLCYEFFKVVVEKYKLSLERIELQETRTSTVIYTKEDYEQDCIQLKLANFSKETM